MSRHPYGRNRRRPLTAWEAAHRQRALEAGATIVAERQRGVRWTDLAERFGLPDEHAARQLACGYLVSLAEPRDADGERAGDAQPRGGADVSPATQRAAREAR